MHMVKKSLALPMLSAVLALLAGFVLAPSARAAAGPGTYRCVSVEAGGKTSPCQSPSLILNSDGSYQIWGEYGTYEVVQDQWLVLSHSKRRGLGYLEKPGQIVFEYKIGKRTCRVTFERVVIPPPGFISS
jgi:hypothetical protein